MFRTTLLALAAPIALAATLFSPNTAEAANRFAVTGIENKSTHTVIYSVKWGDGAWHKVTLKPGERWLHWHTYAKANENKSPSLTIRFDSEFDPNMKPFFIEYALKRSAAPAHDWEDAHKYVFRNDGNKYFIDLKEVK